MKYGSFTIHLNQKDRQLSGQQPVKVVYSDQKLTSQLARFWHPYFRILGFLFTDYRKKGNTINSKNYMVLLGRLSIEIKKKRRHMQNEKTLFHKCRKSMKTMIK